MTRDNWTTATAGHREGYSIAGRCARLIFYVVLFLTVAWAIYPNQTIIN